MTVAVSYMILTFQLQLQKIQHRKLILSSHEISSIGDRRKNLQIQLQQNATCKAVAIVEGKNQLHLMQEDLI